MYIVDLLPHAPFRTMQLLGMWSSFSLNCITVLNVIQRMEKNVKNARFLVKVVNRSIMHVMRIHTILISYVKLDHTLYLINYRNGSHIYCSTVNSDLLVS